VDTAPRLAARTKVTGSAILTPLPAPSPERAAEESPASLEDAHSTDRTKIGAMVTGTGLILDGEDNPASVAIGFTDGDTEVEGAEDMVDTEDMVDGMMMTPATASLESRVAEASPASLADIVPQAVMTSDMDTDTEDGEVMDTLMDTGITAPPPLPAPNLASQVDVSKSSAVHTISEHVSF